MEFEEKFKAFMEGLAPVRSDWEFVTSANGSLAVATPIVRVGVNATGGGLWIKNSKDNTTATLKYGGVGGSFGVELLPSLIDFSFSIPQMPSAGVIYKFPYAGRTLSLSEFEGAFVMFEIFGDVGPGVSGALMFLGCSTFWASVIGLVSEGVLIVPTLMATACACVRFGGLTYSPIPVNAGVNVYIGSIF